jgi:integrase
MGNLYKRTQTRADGVIRELVVHENDGLRKLCGCSRRNWPKCSHPWHFNYKLSGGKAWRFSLDTELGKHIASKGDAELEADKLRTAIRAGTFVRAADRRKQATAPIAVTPDAITLEAFGKKFIDHKAKPSGKKTWTNDAYMFAQLAAFGLRDGTRLGDTPLGAITEDDFEAFYAHLRTIGRAASTRNQYVQLLKASCRWAVKKGYLASSPISDDSTLKRTKIAQRARRLVADVVDKDGTLTEPGDERRLLAVAGQRLQWLIIAALETGCRRGELLSLQWGAVDVPRGELRIRAVNAKDAEDRVLPISSRLAGVLEMARTDPAGQAYQPDAYVFGEVGQPVRNIKRAWETAVLKASGQAPVWTAGTLSPDSRAALRRIDLHFHDLRHEAGSRWLEAGWPLHKVRDMLGHAKIDQTDTYLNASRLGLHEEMRRFDGTRCNPVANKAVSEHTADRNDEQRDSNQVTVN